MKFILSLLCFVSVSVSANSQVSLSFPEDMKFDPTDYSISSLKIREVIQYQTWDKIKRDSSEEIQIVFKPQYVVQYDSSERIKCFKYDLRSPQFWRSTGKISLPEARKIYDSTNYFFYEYEDSIHSFDCYEHQFKYASNGWFTELNSIEVKSPSRFRGILDGVYVKEMTPASRIITDFVHNSKNELIRKTITDNDGEVHRFKYYYETFIREGFHEVSLLIKIEHDFRGSKKCTHIEYRK